ncbi:hypothetical protein [Hahella sp. NBU794]|uniref:hypothetical protein n=1 Tax=Hahella sp. NBU794 TaxID=3422590 RepID=UPI003D6FBDCC
MTKRPREYAAEILQMQGREARARALAAVPTQFRAMVEAHVRTYFALKTKPKAAPTVITPEMARAMIRRRAA